MAKNIQIGEVARSVLARTEEYFSAELGLSVSSAAAERKDIELLSLHDMTIIVAVGGHINLLIAMSFDHSLVEAIFTRMTADIEVLDEEKHQFRCEAVAESVNTILGHCTRDFQSPDYRITLTPPVVLEEAKRLHRTKNAMFHCERMKTSFGMIDINFIGPRELFTTDLDYVK